MVMYLHKQKTFISACETPSASNKLYLILASRNMTNGLSHKRYTAGKGAKINLEYLCCCTKSYTIVKSSQELLASSEVCVFLLPTPAQLQHLFLTCCNKLFSIIQNLVKCPRWDIRTDPINSTSRTAQHSILGKSTALCTVTLPSNSYTN